MIFWICSAITFGAATAATFVSDIRLAVIALWLVGMGAGGIYLSMGAELLAVVQWIVSTLVAASCIFYAVMFGEYRVTDPRPFKAKLISAILPATAGIALAAVVWLAAKHLSLGQQWAPGPLPDGQDVLAIGKMLTDDHFLSLQILALTLFLVIIGAGVVARPEGNGKGGPEA